MEYMFIESQVLIKGVEDEEEDDEEIVKNRRISGWNFCEDDFQFSLVFLIIELDIFEFSLCEVDLV